MPDQDPLTAPSIDSDIVSRPTAVKPERLLSLDVLRGLTIAFMILVNNQPSHDAFFELRHAAWNGFTATDLVFPTFLFLVGISTVLSTAARLARGATRSELFLHTLRRAVLLIVLGFVVNNFPLFHMAHARYYGVLPRIGLCYFVVATLYLISPGWKDKLAIAIACLLGYWILMRFVPIPGIGVPTHAIPINDPDANLGAWLDRCIFSASHLYEHTRDPEGLLSTIPSIATALIGLLTGLWLRTKNSTARKTAALAITAVIFLALALAWNPYFPINKKLWTSSYVLCAAGCSMLLLAASIYVIDVLRLGRRSATGPTTQPPLYRPLLVFGTNAITAYMFAELLSDSLSAIHPQPGVNLEHTIYNHINHVITQPAWAALVYGLIIVLITWLAMLPLYRKRIFLRI
ncbi:MAG: heparan-alpha-glucosaminide N-acetyltransferase domain-containing protein [Acidobacteriota bacterium]